TATVSGLISASFFCFTRKIRQIIYPLCSWVNHLLVTYSTTNCPVLQRVAEVDGKEVVLRGKYNNQIGAITKKPDTRSGAPGFGIGSPGRTPFGRACPELVEGLRASSPGTEKNESASENSHGALHYYRYALVFIPRDGAGG
ncbi:MAG: hypothetical protein ABSF52_24990, partial [Syntrophobacteraceae bacterium]